MLVLSRKKGESAEIIIPPQLMKALLESIGAKVEMPDCSDVEPIKIVSTVVDMRGAAARIGLVATFNGSTLGREMPIHRSEVVAAIERNDNPNYEGVSQS